MKSKRGQAVRQKIEWNSGAKREKKVLKAKKATFNEGQVTVNEELEVEHLPIHHSSRLSREEAKQEAEWAVANANSFNPGTAWQVTKPFFLCNQYDFNKKADQYSCAALCNFDVGQDNVIPVGALLVYIGQGYLKKCFYHRQSNKWKTVNEVTNVFLYGDKQVVLEDLHGLQRVG